MRKLLILLLLIGSGRIFATILIYGDTRNHPEVHQKLVERTKELDVNAIFFTGDMNRKGTSQTEYDEFREIIKPFTAPFYPVRGNHERNLDLYQLNFPSSSGKSYYSFLQLPDSLQVVVLDTNLDISPGSEQYLWLVSELAKATNPVILMLHHPVFSSGYHGDELGLSWYLPNLLAKYQVAAVVSGHEHSFEHLRYKNLDYFVTGGGGAPLREAKASNPNSLFFRMTHHYNLLTRDADALVWQSYDLIGNLLYETRITLPDTP